MVVALGIKLKSMSVRKNTGRCHTVAVQCLACMCIEMSDLIKRKLTSYWLSFFSAWWLVLHYLLGAAWLASN